MTYLLNAFPMSIVPGQAQIEYQFSQVTPCDVPANVVSAIGHKDTAAVVQSLLPQCRITEARISVPVLTETFYVAAYQGPRLPEGCTTLPEGATINFYKVRPGQVFAYKFCPVCGVKQTRDKCQHCEAFAQKLCEGHLDGEYSFSLDKRDLARASLSFSPIEVIGENYSNRGFSPRLDNSNMTFQGFSEEGHAVFSGELRDTGKTLYFSVPPLPPTPHLVTCAGCSGTISDCPNSRTCEGHKEYCPSCE